MAQESPAFPDVDWSRFPEYLRLSVSFWVQVPLLSRFLQGFNARQVALRVVRQIERPTDDNYNSPQESNARSTWASSLKFIS